MKEFSYLLIIAICVILSGKAVAQDAGDYNKQYTKVYLEIAPKNMQLALQMADSLLAVSTTPLYKTKSLMLSATLYQQQQSLTKASELAEEAYKIISETSDYNWMVRISGFLATQYRMLQLYGKSKMYCDRALSMIIKINNPEMVKSTTGLIHQELAYNDMALKKYHSAIRHIRISQKNFDSITQNQEYLTADNEQLLGLNYFHLTDYKRALHHYRNSLNLMKNMSQNVVKGLCYNGIAAIYIETDALSEAKLYLDSASNIAAESQHLALKSEIFKTSQRYYLKVRDLASLEKVQQKQDSVTDKITSSRARFLDSTLIQMEKKTREAQRHIKAGNIPVAIATLFTILSACYFFFSRRRQKRKFGQFMADFEISRTSNTMSTPTTDSAATLPPGEPTDTYNDFNKDHEQKTAASLTKKKASHPVMPEETLQRILARLEEFEMEHLFTSTGISLSFLSSHLNTNSKYLSYVLKQYKQKDFTGYINDLRINYIVKNLKEHPEWRQYKISILAEKAGFSSHSKFTNIFKNYTGLSPSLFIQYLSAEETVSP